MPYSPNHRSVSNKETPVADRIVPRILNSVPNRPATRIELNDRDDDRVRHRALPSLQVLHLGQRKQLEVHNPQRGVGELPGVADEERFLRQPSVAKRSQLSEHSKLTAWQQRISYSEWVF